MKLINRLMIIHIFAILVFSYPADAFATDFPFEQEFTVFKVESVDVHVSDNDSHKIPSNLGVNGMDHFVCVKNTGDIILGATLSPNTPEVADTITWEADGVTITSPAVGSDKRTAKLSSNLSKKIPVRIKSGTNTLWEGLVWVVWSSINTTTTYNISEDIDNTYGIIQGGYRFKATITPDSIITDSDRPALHGNKTGGPPGGTNVCGKPLASGADKHWDMTRQTRQKVVTKPAGWTDTDWAPPACWYTDIQNYPSSDIEGNDDAGTTDEDNDPYSSPDEKQLRSDDGPTSGAKHGAGELNDEIEIRLHFREFIRIELDGNWYRASDFFQWRFHQLFKKLNVNEANFGADINGDGDTNDTVPGWRNNGSVLDTTNEGW